MRLGLSLEYQTPRTTPAEHLALAREADRLGYAVVWAAEAYGSDSPSMLAWLAGQTQQIDLGSAVMQIPARTPAATAMTAATIDALSGGRFRLGLGVSGPQVSEGWHGVRFARPLARTREYVEIVRRALARQPLVYQGTHYQLPLPDGPGKALKLGFRPPRAEIPIYLAALGPRNLRLAGEIADGWLGIFCPRSTWPRSWRRWRRGGPRSGATWPGSMWWPACRWSSGRTWPPAPTGSADTPPCTSGAWAPGSRTSTSARPPGWGTGEAAATVQELYLSGRKREAAAAVPFEFIDQTCLLGPVDRIAERLRAYAEAGSDDPVGHPVRR